MSWPPILTALILGGFLVYLLGMFLVDVLGDIALLLVACGIVAMLSGGAILCALLLGPLVHG